MERNALLKPLPFSPPHKREGIIDALRTVAIIDVGKTNAKVVLLAAGSGAELALRTTGNPVRLDGPYPHVDVARLWEFMCDALAEVGREHPIDSVVVTTHGAAGALIPNSTERYDPALPILDYEFPGPDELAAEYDAVRPDFRESLAPRLPAGLNLGAQIFWQQRNFPEAFAHATYVPYPQYWAWRLTGVAAADVTSIGCHTDLWNPARRTFSAMVDRLGWRSLIAPLRSCFDRLGPVRADLAGRLGIAPSVPVFCGIHDSNASLLPHLMRMNAPFTVVSTGTWIIVLAVGGDTARLDPTRDAVAYVNAFGDPVPGARFMGGREFQQIAGDSPAEPSPAELENVLMQPIMALPSFVPGVGPFPQSQGRWTEPPDGISPGERSAAASLYVALVAAECLRIAGAGGPVIIEGPFAANALFCAALAGICGSPVLASGERTGTVGAALLATGKPFEQPAPPVEIGRLQHPALSGYVEEWRRAAAFQLKAHLHSK